MRVPAAAAHLRPMTTLMSDESTSVIVEERLQTTDVPGDAAHIVMVPPHEDDQTPHAYVLRARIEGFPIVALCGHTFVPQKDPKGLLPCQGCVEIYESEDRTDETGGGLPDA